MYWPGTTAAELGAAGFEAELALRVARPATGPVESAAAAGEQGAHRAFHTPCMDDPDLFFAELPADVETAKALCRGCPIRLACLAGARERREPWGVWGGELLRRGGGVPNKRPRGRPRKTEVAA
jgi:WhiB family transcriptional regulator, redox-sensing transcriptional regulator